MDDGGREHFDLPEYREDHIDGMDDKALEEALLAHRRREFAQLAELNG